MSWRRYTPVLTLLLLIGIILLLWALFGGNRRLVWLDITEPQITGVDIVEASQNLPAPDPRIEEFFKLDPKEYKKGKMSIGEKICKETMEDIYKVPFVTVRPDWLRNPETGRNLELDCYNHELRLAVEYNGEQHYNWPNGFCSSKEEFISLLRRDLFKREVCNRLGIKLIVVPYTVKSKDIPAYIINKLELNSDQGKD